MRHNVKKTKKLGKNNDHRRKLLRSLASSVIVYEKIETTTAKAKAIRSYVDQMITKERRRACTATASSMLTSARTLP